MMRDNGCACVNDLVTNGLQHDADLIENFAEDRSAAGERNER
jgi:hypothetical protein